MPKTNYYLQVNKKNTNFRLKSEPQQTAVIILGMHRSGTSALARIINLLGVDLGTDLMEGAKDNNERGFWEHRKIVNRHEQLFSDLGMSWNDIRKMPSGWLEYSATYDALNDLQSIIYDEFNTATLWGIKDPRMCRLLPLWRKILAAFKMRVTVLHMLRHPLEIACSLKCRDKMSSEQALMLLLRYQTEAVCGSKGIRQSWTSFDQILANWRDEIRRIDSELNLGLVHQMHNATDKIESFLDKKLRHHIIDDKELNIELQFVNWIKKLHNAVMLTNNNNSISYLTSIKKIQKEIKLC
ncbi:glycosyl transferase, group 2 family domain protein [Candidatus Endolissoclinum faulkneri L5]|uniref:Glycosyl transferase, group 2 family domain protein n=1 Tax=Candidatus Endolissoclinum faulkneri L5 TaxID=1401328 RepID=V9TUH8_9PROT|nr:sulfotransferase family protein [Candidatus Endolissoclinum faulkneri]AHC73343.1 glycosyl transferase, group 2 family domain protein [Candidatus Endolissoclinum faulkneri L5]